MITFNLKKNWPLILAGAIACGILLYLALPVIQERITKVNQSIKGVVDEDVVREEIYSAPLRGTVAPSSRSQLSVNGVLEETNIRRIASDIQPLTQNTLLTQAAEAKVQDMFARQYFEHVSPDGNGPGYLAKQEGYAYIVVGENLALGNFDDDGALVSAWMASPGHRENILNERFSEIGIAVGEGMYQGKKVWLAVQEFGKPASSCPTINADLKNQIDAETKDADERNATIITLKKELEGDKPESPEEQDKYNQKVAVYNKEVSKYNTVLASLKADIDQYNIEVRAFNACLKN